MILSGNPIGEHTSDSKRPVRFRKLHQVLKDTIVQEVLEAATSRAAPGAIC